MYDDPILPDDLDLGAVAPHRRAMVLQRIALLNAYQAGSIDSATAMQRLGVASATFWRLARIWRETGRPELLGGIGRQVVSRTQLDRNQDELVREVTQQVRLGVRATTEAVIALAREKGMIMPGRDTIGRRIEEIRRESKAKTDTRSVLVAFCAVQLPALHPIHGAVAPIACLALDVATRPVLLGFGLTFEADEVTAASALLDAIATSDGPAADPIDPLIVHTGMGEGWSAIETSLRSAGLPMTPTTITTRSGRAVTAACGPRPGGVVLRPDLTARPLQGRPLPSPPGGAATLMEVEEAARARLLAALPGRRRAIVEDADLRGRLALALRRIVLRTTGSKA